MQGQWLRGMAYYRCRFPDQYAMANHLAHPRNVYLREDHITPPLDDWLLTALAPDHLEATVEAMYTSQPTGMTEKPVDLAQHTITECDRKIANYRALLDAGTDPSLVAGWIAEVTAVRTAAQAQQASRQAPTRQARLTRQQIRGLIRAVGDLRTAIRRADAKPAKTALYQQLRIRLTYDPGNNNVRAEADLGPDVVGIGFVSEAGHDRRAHGDRNKRDVLPIATARLARYVGVYAPFPECVLTRPVLDADRDRPLGALALGPRSPHTWATQRDAT